MALRGLRGVNEMKARLALIQRNAPGVVGRALRQETEVEATECKRCCPVDVTPHAPHPGNLRKSIRAEGPEFDGASIRCAVIAGGAEAPYAIYVHEILENVHPVGEAKYVERPLNASAPYILERVARRIDLNEALKGAK